MIFFIMADCFFFHGQVLNTYTQYCIGKTKLNYLSVFMQVFCDVKILSTVYYYL
jgi:hypothetical protein